MDITHLHFERKKPLDVLSTPSGFGEQTSEVCSFFSSNLNNFSYLLRNYVGDGLRDVPKNHFTTVPLFHFHQSFFTQTVIFNKVYKIKP